MFELLTSHFTVIVHRVSENVPPFARYNSDTCEWILIFFGRNVTDKVSNQDILLRHIN